MYFKFQSKEVFTLPIHDYPLRQTTVNLLVLPQRPGNPRLHGVAQLLVGAVVQIGRGDEPREGRVEGGHQSSHRLTLVKGVMVGVVAVTG